MKTSFPRPRLSAIASGCSLCLAGAYFLSFALGARPGYGISLSATLLATMLGGLWLSARKRDDNIRFPLETFARSWPFWLALAWSRGLVDSNRVINLVLLSGFTVSACLRAADLLARSSRLSNFASPRRVRLVSALSATCFTLVFSIQTWMKYNSFRAYWMDLGYMLHPIWNTTQGRWFEYFYVDGTFRSSLGDHFSLIFFPIAAVFKLFPYAYTLFFIQALAGAVGGILVYILAKDLFESKKTALVMQLAFYFYAPLQYGMITDFHADPLGVPFLMMILIGFHRRKFGLFLAGFILSLTVKEHVGLVLAPLMIILGFRYKPWRLPAFGLSVAGVVFSVAAWNYFIPHFNHGEEALSLAVLYPGGEDGLGGVIGTMITEPVQTIKRFVSVHNFEQLTWLLLPLLFLPVFAVPEIGALTIFLAKELYAVFVMHNHHQALMAPILFWCLMLVIRRRFPDTNRTVSVAVLLSCILIGFISGESPLSHRFYRAGPSWYFPSAHSRALNQAVELVPPGKSVSADSHIAIHLYDRRKLHLFPHPFPDDSTSYVLIDRQHYESGTEIRHFTWDKKPRSSILATFDSLKAGGTYDLIFDTDGVEVLRKKDAPSSAD